MSRGFAYFKELGRVIPVIDEGDDLPKEADYAAAAALTERDVEMDRALADAVVDGSSQTVWWLLQRGRSRAVCTVRWRSAHEDVEVRVTIDGGLQSGVRVQSMADAYDWANAEFEELLRNGWGA